jgi:hypothetical protein
MKKSLVPVSRLAILMVAGLAALPVRGQPASTSDPAQPPETVVFDLKYRALTGQEDPLSYHSYWGFGASPAQGIAFLDAVKKQVKEYDEVFNGALPKAQQWSIVELKDRKPVALYFDLNADGKLSDDERIAPSSTSRPATGGYTYAFVTPDFTIHKENGQEVLFRIMLVGDTYGGDRMNYMWTPSALLEGQATFAGEPMRLFLYANGFDGTFDAFGRGSFALVPVSQPLQGYISRDTLSSLVCRDGKYYKLSLDGSCEKGKTLQVKLQRDTSPIGRTAFSLKGKEALKTRLTYARIAGAEDQTIQFSTNNAQTVIPVGRYRLDSGGVCYGVESDDAWQVTFSGGPAFTIAKDEATPVEIGDLVLTVKAVDERQRYNSDVKEKTTFAKETPLYMSLEIKGKAGEAYTRFSQKGTGDNQWTPIKPHVSIVGADGKEIASADMEYG